MKRCVFSAEMRPRGIGVNVRICNNCIEPIPDPKKGRMKPIQVFRRFERVVIAGDVLDDVAESTSATDIRRKKAPTIVEPELTEIRLKRHTHSLDQRAYVRRRRDQRGNGVPREESRQPGE